VKAFLIFITILGFIFYAAIATILFFFGAGEQKAKKPVRIIAMLAAVAAFVVMVKAIIFLFKYGWPL